MARDLPPFSPEMRHLRALIHVARTGSVSRAAADMDLTQSRVSQLLKQLETGLNIALFTRIGKRLTLTPAGRMLANGAADILGKLDLALRDATNPSNLERGHLNIGVVPACNRRFMPEILARLHQRHPGYTVAVAEGSADDLERGIETGRLDVALGFLPHASPSLRYQPVLKERFALIVGRAHPLAEHAPFPAERLHELELVLLPGRYYMRQLSDRFFSRHRVRPRVTFEIDSLPAIIQTVHGSHLATLLPPFVVARNEAAGLISRPLDGRQISLEVGLMQPRRGGPNPLVERFVELARRVVASE